MYEYCFNSTSRDRLGFYAEIQIFVVIVWNMYMKGQINRTELKNWNNGQIEREYMNLQAKPEVKLLVETCRV